MTFDIDVLCEAKDTGTGIVGGTTKTIYFTGFFYLPTENAPWNKIPK